MTTKSESLRRIADALELRNQPIVELKKQNAALQARLDEAMIGWKGWHAEAERLKGELTAHQKAEAAAVKTARESLFVRNDTEEALRFKTSQLIERDLDLRDARAKIQKLEDMLEDDCRGVTAAQAATKAAEAKLRDFKSPWDKQRAKYEKTIANLRKIAAGKSSKLAYWKSKAVALSKTLDHYRNARTNTR